MEGTDSRKGLIYVAAAVAVVAALIGLTQGRIVGIHSVDLVWGLGTLHCLTQQQPAPRRMQG